VSAISNTFNAGVMGSVFVYQDVGILAQVAIRLSFDYPLDRCARV
jgi:hypothetical protein